MTPDSPNFRKPTTPDASKTVKGLNPDSPKNKTITMNYGNNINSNRRESQMSKQASPAKPRNDENALVLTSKRCIDITDQNGFANQDSSESNKH